jgi:hypothetical protein
MSYQIASSSRHGGTPRNDGEGLFPHPAKIERSTREIFPLLPKTAQTPIPLKSQKAIVMSGSLF